MCFQKRLSEAHSRVLIFSLRCVVFFNKTGFKLSRVSEALECSRGDDMNSLTDPFTFCHHHTVRSAGFCSCIGFVSLLSISTIAILLIFIVFYGVMNQILITCYACTHLNFKQNKCKFKCTYVYVSYVGEFLCLECWLMLTDVSRFFRQLQWTFCCLYLYIFFTINYCFTSL